MVGYLGFQQVIDKCRDNIDELLSRRSVMDIPGMSFSIDAHPFPELLPYPAIFDMLSIFLEDLNAFKSDKGDRKEKANYNFDHVETAIRNITNEAPEPAGEMKSEAISLSLHGEPIAPSGVDSTGESPTKQTAPPTSPSPASWHKTKPSTVISEIGEGFGVELLMSSRSNLRHARIVRSFSNRRRHHAASMPLLRVTFLLPQLLRQHRLSQHRMRHRHSWLKWMMKGRRFAVSIHRGF